MYAKSGTEAVAESFYRVVEKQEMDGGQSLKAIVQRLTGVFRPSYSVNAH